MQGKDVKSVLDTITAENLTNGSLSELWAILPDFISGEAWVSEIADCALTLSDYFNDENDISTNSKDDLQYDYANSEIEDYYSNINKRVQALSLWAYSDLDEEVEYRLDAFGAKPKTLKELNSDYLFCAMQGLAYQVLSYAYEKAEEELDKQADLEGANA